MIQEYPVQLSGHERELLFRVLRLCQRGFNQHDVDDETITYFETAFDLEAPLPRQELAFLNAKVQTALRWTRAKRNRAMERELVGLASHLQPRLEAYA